MTFIEVHDDKGDCMQLNIKAIKTFSSTAVSKEPHDSRFPIDLGELDVEVDIVAVDGSKYTYRNELVCFSTDLGIDFRGLLGGFVIKE